MERSNMNLASRLSRERTAALERSLEDRRRHADRGVVIAPVTQVVDAIAAWAPGSTVSPLGRRPRLS